jgi:hypothetical protein
MKIGIYSYYNEDLNSEIPDLQKKVFDKFKLKITQIAGKSALKNNYDFDYEDHPNALTNIINSSNEDFIIFFDIDCVPLSYNFYDILINQIKDNNTLAGAIQCANHIDKNKSYVSPAFCGFSKQLYYDCNKPSFNTDRTAITGCDNMQRFTEVCLKMNKNILYWNVTHGGNEKWDIKSHNTKFGNGTIYENLIYHQFEIRYEENHKSFINKCKYILNYEK